MMKHLQKPGVQMALLFAVVLIGGAAYYLSTRPPPPVNVPPDKETPKTKGVGQMAVEEKKVEAGQQRTAEVSTDVSRLMLPKEKPKPPPTLIETSSAQQQQKNNQPPPLPKLVHVKKDLAEPYIPKAPTFFAPRGLLIKAALVITVDSSSLQTPVLALVTEDVYFKGRLIVPAGTQVLAQAAQGRSRDRIEVKGAYTFIWADGREYRINGIALDHERLPDGTYGITDGSAGIRGQIIKADAYAELKILVAEALQGIMNNQQDQFQSIYGLAPQNNSRNAALGGGSQAASAYSQMLTEKLGQDMDFVRIAAGTQFYIFTLDVFEPDLASIAGLTQGEEPTSSWKLAEETYARAQAEQAALGQQAAAADAQAERVRAIEQSSAPVSRVRSIVAGESSAASTPTRSEP